MKILIISKKTGLGNQVQFTPVIIYLLSIGHKVYSDSTIYADLVLKVEPDKEKKYDRIYIPFGYNWLDVLKICLRYPFTKKYGYKYRIRGFHFKLGYYVAYKFSHDKSEFMQNVVNFGGALNYPERKVPKNGKAVIHYTDRPNRGLKRETVIGMVNFLTDYYHDIVVVGDNPFQYSYLTGKHYKQTPKLSDLIKIIKTAQYYIGPDTGVMHVADFFRVKSLVYFGPTSAIKSGAIYGKNIQGDCQPCYKWGKTHCTKENKFHCLDVPLYKIVQDYESL
jgi:hypothetical protein